MNHQHLDYFKTIIFSVFDAEHKKLYGHKRKVRFDSRIEWIALAYFLQFRKSGHQILREISLIIIQSQIINIKKIYILGAAKVELLPDFQRSFLML